MTNEEITALQSEIRDLEQENADLRAPIEAAARESAYISGLCDQRQKLLRENWLMKQGHPPHATIRTPYDDDDGYDTEDA